MTTALYPGSFDPVTLGHLDILDRSASIFERVVIAVLENPSKEPIFSAAERVQMIRESLGERRRIEVGTFNGLTTDYARQVGAGVIVKGLRAVSDFESEFQQALMNRRLYPEVTTVFIPTSLRYLFLSSSLIKELSAFGGDISEFVPAPVARRLGIGSVRGEKPHERARNHRPHRVPGHPRPADPTHQIGGDRRGRGHGAPRRASPQPA